MMPVRWLKILSANLLLSVLGLLLLEAGARVALTAKSCFEGSCDTSQLTRWTVAGNELVQRDQLTKHVGLTTLDRELGYVPSENFKAVINESRWDGATVTIDGNGFRSNDNDLPLDRKNRILALGDSFTFGDKVSNHETWSACLERKTGRQVDNAGVFGYGTAQALKRGAQITAKRNYDTVILSTLVGHDFERDRYMYHIGFARPAVINVNGKIGWSAVPGPYASGTRYNPEINRGLLFLHRHSLVASSLMTYSDTIVRDRLTVEHPEAASKDEIIRWTIAELSRIAARRKLFVLQYRRKLDSGKVVRERQFLLQALAEGGVDYVDTYDLFKGKETSIYWKGHHTPLGNSVVCEAIALKIGG